MDPSSAEYRPRLENPSAFRGDAKIFYQPRDERPVSKLLGLPLRRRASPLEHIVKYKRL
jgi:hypothetical protein